MREQFLGVGITTQREYFKLNDVIIEGEKLPLPPLKGERPGALIWTTIEGERHA